jgi:Domain of unknown function (DUF5615)
MKILLDSCVWGGAKAELSSLGHDVIWCGEWDADPGNDEILAHAFKEGRVLVTLNKDFGELAPSSIAPAAPASRNSRRDSRARSLMICPPNNGSDQSLVARHSSPIGLICSRAAQTAQGVSG